MAMNKEKLIPLTVGVQLGWNTTSLKIIEPRNKAASFKLSETGQSDELPEIPKGRTAYINDRTMGIVRTVLKVDPKEEESDVIKKLVAFRSGTYIKFDPDDANIELMSGIVAYEDKKADKYEVPFGYRLYVLASNLSIDPKKCSRDYATINDPKYPDHPMTNFKLLARFFARPEDRFPLMKSKYDKNGFVDNKSSKR
jgi:hypothetical protein